MPLSEKHLHQIRLILADPTTDPKMRAEVERVMLEEATFDQRCPWAAYAERPIEYAKEILGVTLSPDQKLAFLAMLKPPYRIHIDSGHSIGKSVLMAVMINWFFDSYDPCVVILISTTMRQILKNVWAPLKILRKRAQERIPNYPMPMKPEAPEMKTSEDHYVIGLTADTGETLQGKHPERMLIVYDESDGLPAIYFEAVSTMFDSSGKHYAVSGCNPVSNSSAVYLETQKVGITGKPLWKTFSISCLDHPNIRAELEGKPIPYPGAVVAQQIDDWIVEFACEKLDENEDHQAGDFEWAIEDPKTGKRTKKVWFRPSGLAESRILGRRPTQSMSGIWSHALWHSCIKIEERPDLNGGKKGLDENGKPIPENMKQLPFPLDELPQVGCDVGRFGGDATAFHGRWGGVSLLHDWVYGWDTTRITARCKQICDELCEFANAIKKHQCEKDGTEFKPFYPTNIPVKIDATGGYGGGVSDQRGKYNFIEVNSSNKAMADLKFPNIRSELWFTVADRARMGLLDLSHLEESELQMLGTEATAVRYTMDAAQRRVVEEKKEIKKRIKRSCDSLDAFNLAYFNATRPVPHMIGQQISTGKDGSTMAGRHGTLGRGPNNENDRHTFLHGAPPQPEKRLKTFGR